MSKVSSKKEVAQASICNFFHPVSQADSAKEKSTPPKTFEKRIHKDIEDANGDSIKIDKKLAPNAKSVPPKKNLESQSAKLVKDMENNIDSLLNNNSGTKKTKKKKIKNEIFYFLCLFLSYYKY